MLPHSIPSLGVVGHGLFATRLVAVVGSNQPGLKLFVRASSNLSLVATIGGTYRVGRISAGSHTIGCGNREQKPVAPFIILSEGGDRSVPTSQVRFRYQKC